MERCFFILLACLLLAASLAGCRQERPGDDSAQNHSGLAVLSGEEDVNAPALPDEYGYYPVSEVGYLSGEYTVNELIRRYGQPDSLEGYILSMSSLSLGVEARFGGITYELLVPQEGVMSFDNEDTWSQEGGEEPEKFLLTDVDKARTLRVIGVNIVSKTALLPRGIRMGDSRQRMLDAYPGLTKNQEATVDKTWVSVPYCPDEHLGQSPADSEGNPDSERGAVWYHFSEDDELIEVSISWIDEYLYFD